MVKRLLFAVAIALVGTVLMPGVSNAQPSGCSYGIFASGSGGTSYAYCTGGTGQFRPTVKCLTRYGGTVNAYGPWTNTPIHGFVLARCPAYTSPYSPGIQYR